MDITSLYDDIQVRFGLTARLRLECAIANYLFEPETHDERRTGKRMAMRFDERLTRDTVPSSSVDRHDTVRTPVAPTQRSAA